MNIKELMESGSNVSVTMNLADLKEAFSYGTKKRSSAYHPRKQRITLRWKKQHPCWDVALTPCGVGTE